MTEIKKYEMQYGEYYLVFTGYDWSPSGYDIGCYSRNGELESQSNAEDLLKKLRIIKIYNLPE